MSGRWRVLAGILLVAALWLLWSRWPSDAPRQDPSVNPDRQRPGTSSAISETGGVDRRYEMGGEIDPLVPGQGEPLDWRERIRHLRNSPPPEFFGLQGRVVTEKEQAAVEGADLFLYAQRNPVTHAFSELRGKTSSGADGEFRLVVAEPFQGWLAIRREGFAHFEQAVYLLTAGTESRTYELSAAVATLSGQVLEAIEDVPAVGATVEVGFGEADEDIPRPSALLTRTAADGSYRIDGIPAGRVTVKASLPGCFEGSRSLMMEGGDHELDLTVIRADEAVSLQIRNREGAVLSQAVVERPDGITVQADDKGRVILPLISELPSLRFRAWAPGYIGRQVELEVPPVSDVVVLEKGPRFQGRVVSEANRPIAGARVQIYTKRALRPELEQSTRTDEDGRFEVGLSRPPLEALRVTRRGYAGTEISYSPGQAPASVEVVLRQAETALSGRVVDPEGKPVPAFRLELRPTTPGSYSYGRRFSSPKGEFFIEELPPGRYSLTASVAPEGFEFDMRKFSYLYGVVQGLELIQGEVTTIEVQLVARELERRLPKRLRPTPAAPN